MHGLEVLACSLMQKPVIEETPLRSVSLTLLERLVFPLLLGSGADTEGESLAPLAPMWFSNCCDEPCCESSATAAVAELLADVPEALADAPMFDSMEVKATSRAGDCSAMHSDASKV